MSNGAISGSDGVGFLLSNELQTVYNANVTDDTFDGILWLKLLLKGGGDLGILLCVCYLSPGGSSQGKISHEFFDTLLAQSYMYFDGCPAVFLGDYNARIGGKQDTCIDSTIVRERGTADQNCNKFGDQFLDFLSDANCCVMNGRFDITRINNISVSKRGVATDDYIFVPYAHLEYIFDVYVTSASDAMARHDIVPHMYAKAPITRS